MPIEIRELVIKATVLSQGGNPAEAGKSAAAHTAGNEGSEKEDIIKACLDRVMDILKDKYER